MSNGMAALGLIGFLVWMFAAVLGLVLAVLWILMPFAVFSIRRRLEEEQALLVRIEGHLAKIAAREPASPPAA